MSDQNASKKFKGIILAGGTGSRLSPITRVLNKNLLPVYDKPAIQYSLELLHNAGIHDIAIVAEPYYIDDIRIVLGYGASFDVDITYISDTDDRQGTAQAVGFAKSFAQGFNTVVIAADNIFDINIANDVESFTSGALIYAKEVHDPDRYEICEVNANGVVTSLEEKPEKTQSNLAVPLLYIYDTNLFAYVDKVQPGSNGEYCLTDVNKMYMKQSHLRAKVIESFWVDAGTFDGLATASHYWHEKKTQQLGRHPQSSIRNLFSTRSPQRSPWEGVQNRPSYL